MVNSCVISGSESLEWILKCNLKWCKFNIKMLNYNKTTDYLAIGKLSQFVIINKPPKWEGM